LTGFLIRLARGGPAAANDACRIPSSGSGRRSYGLITAEWIDALRRGRRPMPATAAVIVACVGVWLASLAAGGPVWSGSVRGPVEHALARNAVLIAKGQWWRALSYGTLNLSVFALAYVMALLLLAGWQVERTYGTVRFLAVLVPAWTAGALVGLLVEPAHAFNAGTSGATFGVATAATIDLLRRGVRWHRTFWVPTLGLILALGFTLPASVTWGAHVGGIVAGGIVALIACDPRRAEDRLRLIWAVVLAAVVAAASLLAVPIAARHTVDHGPVLVGAPTGGPSQWPGQRVAISRMSATTPMSSSVPRPCRQSWLLATFYDCPVSSPEDHGRVAPEAVSSP
jgi:membrane associated rhomboid family serine protease